MISKEEMIKAIYENMTDKTLIVGSKIIRLLKNGEGKEDIILEKKSEVLYRTDLGYLHLKDNSGDYEIKNPVMIGRMDILIEKGPNYFNEWNEILDLWEKKDEPIENQNENLINIIYNKILTLNNKTI